jgi:hypothetical protein
VQGAQRDGSNQIGAGPHRCISILNPLRASGSIVEVAMVFRWFANEEKTSNALTRAGVSVRM